MSFCPPVSSPITKLTYMDAYVPPTGISSCIPDTSIISEEGTVDAAALNAFVEGLLSKNAPALDTISPPQNGNPAQDFSAKSKALRDSMQAEYCFYYNRYIWALTKVLTDATSSGGMVDPAVKNNTAKLNTKLNTILLVMKAAVNSRMNTLSSYYNTDVNKLNSELDDARGKLASHSNILQNNDLKADVQAAMVDYSIEKNSSSRNLLAVYGFLNVVAAGLLFYLYTNTKA